MNLHTAASKICLFDFSVDVSADLKSDLSEAYRILRNCCSEEKNRLEVVLRYRETVSVTVDLLQKFVEDGKKDEEDLTFLNRAVQFLGNLSVGPIEATELIWKTIPFGFWVKVISAYPGEKIGKNILMPFRSCLVVGSGDVKKHPEEFGPLIEAVFCTFSDNDWAFLSCETLLSLDGFLRIYWPCCTPEARCDLFRSILRFGPVQLQDFISSDNLSFCSEVFLSETRDVDWSGPPEKFDPGRIRVFRELLSLLCHVTSMTELNVPLKTDTDLFRNTLEFLKTAIKLGKFGHPFFKSNKSLSNFGNSNPNSLCFGLKRDLVSLIGNMSFRNPEIQILGFEFDALSTVLDCTSLETDNPFITQWSVLAVRNLCENCVENQRILAVLSPKGILDRTDLLDKLGLEVSVDENGSVLLKRTSE